MATKSLSISLFSNVPASTGAARLRRGFGGQVSQFSRFRDFELRRPRVHMCVQVHTCAHVREATA